MEYHAAFENDVSEESFMTWRNSHDIRTKKNEVINQKCIHAFLCKCVYVNVCLEKRLESSCCRLNICVPPPQIHMLKLHPSPDVMVLGGEVFGR